MIERSDDEVHTMADVWDVYVSIVNYAGTEEDAARDRSVMHMQTAIVLTALLGLRNEANPASLKRCAMELLEDCHSAIDARETELLSRRNQPDALQ